MTRFRAPAPRSVLIRRVRGVARVAARPQLWRSPVLKPAVPAGGSTRTAGARAPHSLHNSVTDQAYDYVTTFIWYANIRIEVTDGHGDEDGDEREADHEAGHADVVPAAVHESVHSDCLRLGLITTVFDFHPSSFRFLVVSLGICKWVDMSSYFR